VTARQLRVPKKHRVSTIRQTPHGNYGYTLAILGRVDCALPVTATPLLLSGLFEPEEIKAMRVAFARVCTALAVSDNQHGFADQIAQMIVEVAPTTEPDADDLTAAVLRIFRKDHAS
jgi:hypothetical protein